MAATAWAIYKSAKKKLGQGSMVLSGQPYRLYLAKSNSNAQTALGTISLLSEVTNRLASTSGFGGTGKPLSAEAWTSTGAGSGFRFDASVGVITASGTAMSAARMAVIAHSGGALLCQCSLSSGDITLNVGSSLTITINNSGIAGVFKLI